MKISIVTISYNQVDFLSRCIESVMSQNYENFEHIIVDPGSTDGSRELIESYGNKVVPLFEKDNGPSDGLNKGFALATGDIGFFLNSDDVLLPNSLCFVSEYFDNNGYVDVLMGSGYYIDSNDLIIKKVYPSLFSADNYLYQSVSFIQQSVFFKLSAFKSSGGFNLENKNCWDGELFLDMALSGCQFRRTFKELGCFRIHDEGITGSGRQYEEYKVERERIFRKAKGREKNLVDIIRSRISYFMMNLSDIKLLTARLFDDKGTGRKV